jgi:hypothetical protein
LLPELVEVRAGGLIPIARQWREFPGADLSFHTAAGYGGCQGKPRFPTPPWNERP